MILKCTAPQEISDLREFINEKALLLGMTVAILSYENESDLQRVIVLFLNEQTYLKIPLLQVELEKSKIVVETIEEKHYGI